MWFFLFFFPFFVVFFLAGGPIGAGLAAQLDIALVETGGVDDWDQVGTG